MKRFYRLTSKVWLKVIPIYLWELIKIAPGRLEEMAYL
uniref:Uncharacterized protein n=1 Tax=Arundo donax TaxID=35708 RepID=A0A0A9AFE7_ARUDO